VQRLAAQIPCSTTACCWTGLLCRSKNEIVVEYALRLRPSKRPIGVSGWETQIVEKLPEDLKGSLPSVDEIEAELGAKGTRR